MTRLRVVLSIAALALGAALLALAHDVTAWDHAADTGRVGPTWLPGDPASALLALEDDRVLRRAERAFARAVAAPEGFAGDTKKARLRAEAEVALSEAVELGSARQASRAGNLLGILAATPQGPADVGEVAQRAAAAFDAAVRADPENVEPKYNLELLLRMMLVVGTREGAGFGSGNAGPSQGGAGAGRRGWGY